MRYSSTSKYKQVSAKYYARKGHPVFSNLTYIIIGRPKSISFKANKTHPKNEPFLRFAATFFGGFLSAKTYH